VRATRLTVPHQASVSAARPQGAAKSPGARCFTNEKCFCTRSAAATERVVTWEAMRPAKKQSSDVRLGWPASPQCASSSCTPAIRYDGVQHQVPQKRSRDTGAHTTAHFTTATATQRTHLGERSQRLVHRLALALRLRSTASHLDVASTAAARASTRCRRLGLEQLEEANVLQRVPDEASCSRITEPHTQG
jgi:hypothetical protein